MGAKWRTALAPDESAELLEIDREICALKRVIDIYQRDKHAIIKRSYRRAKRKEKANGHEKD